jgi:hypothetical protein
MRLSIRATSGAFLILLAIMCGCAGTTTSLKHVWMDQGIRQEPIKKIMIIGIHESSMIRRVFEEQIAASFESRGVTAISSLELIPPNKEIDRDLIKSAIEGSDVDAVLVTRLIGIDKQTEWVQGSDYVVPRGHYNTFYGYYSTTYQVVHDPGYLVDYTIVNLETNIYDVATEKLVWAALSETFDPQSSLEIIDSLGKKVIRELSESGMIK